jgi:3-deoxy-D-arabino-heptulosonate 7-phosphate (DAHP) synthase
LEFLKVPNIKQMPEVPIIVDPEQSKARLSKEITLLSLALLCSTLLMA